jgi:flagellar hook-associated protein 3 FlgL
MTILNGISFLGQSNAQISRLGDLNSTLADLERQLTTTKKYDTLSGLGTDAQKVQGYRISKDTVSGYLTNIDTTITRINAQSAALTSAADEGRQLIQTLTLQGQDGTQDVGTINQLAQQALSFVTDLANQKLDGRYIFAGSDATSQPYTDSNALDVSFQTQITDWQNGTITTDQLLANVGNFDESDLGLNPALSASGNVTAHIDDNTDIDYTVKADTGGFEDIIKALGFAANITKPGATDAPTGADLDAVVKQILTMTQDAVAKLDSSNAALGAKLGLIQNVQSSHTQDVNTLTTLISGKEDADTTEVVAKIQSLQTQLQASYQVTSIVSQLSLINYIK